MQMGVHVLTCMSCCSHTFDRCTRTHSSCRWVSRCIAQSIAAQSAVFGTLCSDLHSHTRSPLKTMTQLVHLDTVGKIDAATSTRSEEDCTNADKQKGPSQKVKKELYGQAGSSEEHLEFTNGHCCAHMVYGKGNKSRATQKGSGLQQFWLKGMSKADNGSFRAAFRPRGGPRTDDIAWMMVLIGRPGEDEVFHRRMVVKMESEILPCPITIDDPWTEGDYENEIGQIVQVHALKVAGNANAICHEFISDMVYGSASTCPTPLGTYVLRAREGEVEPATEWWMERVDGAQRPPHVLPSPITRFIMGKCPITRMSLRNRCVDRILHELCKKQGVFCLCLQKMEGQGPQWFGDVYGEAPGCALQVLDSIQDPVEETEDMTQSEAGREGTYMPHRPLTKQEKRERDVLGCDVTEVPQGYELRFGGKVWFVAKPVVGVRPARENCLKCPACTKHLNGPIQLAEHFGRSKCKPETDFQRSLRQQ